MAALPVPQAQAQAPAPAYTSLEEAFELFAKIADARGEQYRAFSYRRAIAAPEAIGARLRQKTAEYCATGRIAQLDELLAAPETRAYLEFDRVLGFGPTTIRALISQGILSREDLIRAVQLQKVLLTPIQDLGLRYFDDLQRKIPRDDVARVSEIIFTEIFKTARELFDEQTAHQLLVEVAGSYRRRAPMSSDIDILVTSPPATGHRARRQNSGGDPGRSLLHHLHERLRANPDFVSLVVLGSQKYSFLFHYRWVISIDIIYVPHESYYAALIYFTGSQSFNIWMREQFKKIGYSLNQYDLTSIDGKTVQLVSEEQAFALLGIPYIPPQNRAKPPHHPHTITPAITK